MTWELLPCCCGSPSPCPCASTLPSSLLVNWSVSLNLAPPDCPATNPFSACPIGPVNGGGHLTSCSPLYVSSGGGGIVNCHYIDGSLSLQSSFVATFVPSTIIFGNPTPCQYRFTGSVPLETLGACARLPSSSGLDPGDCAYGVPVEPFNLSVDIVILPPEAPLYQWRATCVIGLATVKFVANTTPGSECLIPSNWQRSAFFPEIETLNCFEAFHNFNPPFGTAQGLRCSIISANGGGLVTT